MNGLTHQNNRDLLGGAGDSQRIGETLLAIIQNEGPGTLSSRALLLDDHANHQTGWPPFGVVFAAHGGSSTPLPGANVTLLTDISSNTSLNIPPGAGIPPNTQNLNPAIADGQGRYNFTLLPEQLGSVSAAATYYLRASAPGFMNRMLRVSLSATGLSAFGDFQVGTIAYTINGHILNAGSIAISGVIF